MHTVPVIYYLCASRYMRYFLVEVNEWTLTLVSIEWSSVGINTFPFLQCKDSSCFSFSTFIKKRNKDVMFNFFLKKYSRDYCNKDVLYFHFIPKAYYSWPSTSAGFASMGHVPTDSTNCRSNIFWGKNHGKFQEAKLEFSTCGELHLNPQKWSNVQANAAVAYMQTRSSCNILRALVPGPPLPKPKSLDAQAPYVKWCGICI